jgi:hypothetical protein
MLISPPLASQSRADDMLEGPESLSENEVAAAFDGIEQRIAESPGSTIDPKLGGHEILAGRIYDFAELEQVDKGIVSGAFEDDVQQVGSVSEDGVSWDVQSLLTLEGRESFAKFCQGWQLPFCQQLVKTKPRRFAPYTISHSHATAERSFINVRVIFVNLSNDCSSHIQTNAMRPTAQLEDTRRLQPQGVFGDTRDDIMCVVRI